MQFAQGVGDFNLWQHRPHPPGYPLYVASGWLFSHALPLGVPTALYLASALGGGLFVACWFALIAQTFGRAVACWFAGSLGTLLITWMTATKVLTDALGAGGLALTLLLVTNRRLVPAAVAGALTVGVRPQTFPVVLLIVGLAAARLPRRWLAGVGTFLVVCLGWLLPTMALQARTPDSHGDWLAYPAQLLAQWSWRLDQPKVFVGADTHGESLLAYRLDHHALGLLTRGFGFGIDSLRGWLGIVLLVFGYTFYALTLRRSSLSAPHAPFWKIHLPWAALYVVIVFCCLPGDQRYYLPVFPLLILPALLGWRDIFPAPPGRALIAVIPAATALATLPFVARNHREPAPPVRMLRDLQASLSPTDRPHVCLILQDSLRHAQWYAPGLPLMTAADYLAHGPSVLPSAATLLFTDDPDVTQAPLPPNAPPDGWTALGPWQRSPLIYRKHSEVTLYWLSRPLPASSTDFLKQ